jgi:hypothetical protein
MIILTLLNNPSSLPPYAIACSITAPAPEDASDSYTGRVSTKFGNMLLYPFECKPHIQDTSIGLAIFVDILG